MSLELLQECTDDSVKADMAEALLNAPVSKISGKHAYVNNHGAEQLLDIFAVEQSHQFLTKAYNCVLRSNSVSGVTMCRNNTACGNGPFVFDSYVVGCLQKFQCTALEMGRDMKVEHSDITVDLLPLLTLGVSEKLDISNCKLLCGQRDQQVDHRDDTGAVPSTALHLELSCTTGVNQLRGCDVTLPHVGRLDLKDCGDVDICGLSHAFTQLCELTVEVGQQTGLQCWLQTTGRDEENWTCGIVVK